LASLRFSVSGLLVGQSVPDASLPHQAHVMRVQEFSLIGFRLHGFNGHAVLLQHVPVALLKGVFAQATAVSRLKCLSVHVSEF
jgi:hypothetical protein